MLICHKYTIDTIKFHNTIMIQLLICSYCYNSFFVDELWLSKSNVYSYMFYLGYNMKLHSFSTPILLKNLYVWIIFKHCSHYIDYYYFFLLILSCRHFILKTAVRWGKNK
jgi:hypothetical protein